eukprot:359071-Chlamydomonas_euryale.AAC.3
MPLPCMPSRHMYAIPTHVCHPDACTAKSSDHWRKVITGGKPASQRVWGTELSRSRETLRHILWQELQTWAVRRARRPRHSSHSKPIHLHHSRALRPSAPIHPPFTHTHALTCCCAPTQSALPPPTHTRTLHTHLCHDTDRRHAWSVWSVQRQHFQKVGLRLVGAALLFESLKTRVGRWAVRRGQRLWGGPPSLRACGYILRMVVRRGRRLWCMCSGLRV